MDAHHLFHQVGLAVDVGAPGRRNRRKAPVVLGHLEAERAEDLRGIGGRQRKTAQTVDAVPAEHRSPPPRRRGTREHQLAGLAPAQLQDQPRCLLGTRFDERGIDPAFEAVPGVGLDPVAPAGSGGAQGIEQGRLHEDVGRVRGTAGPLTAQDAAHGERPAVVRDHGHCVVEGVFLAVERGQGLAVACEPHVNAAGELVRVEGVQRPGIGQADVVGDVHEGRDRAQANGSEAALHPFRRGTVPHAEDHAPHEIRAGAGEGVV